MLHSNQSFKKKFNTLLIVAFRKDTGLKQIIGTDTIHNSKKLIKTKNKHQTGKCVPCNSTRCICCQQRISATTFKSNQTNKPFEFYHRVKCQSSFVIYLLEYYICNIQYVGKSETPFNISLNNHREDAKNPNAIPVFKHFNRHDNDFNIRRKIIIIKYDINWDIKRNTKTAIKVLVNKTWNFGATWSKSRLRLRPHAFCWSTIPQNNWSPSSSASSSLSFSLLTNKHDNKEHKPQYN